MWEVAVKRELLNERRVIPLQPERGGDSAVFFKTISSRRRRRSARTAIPIIPNTVCIFSTSGIAQLVAYVLHALRATVAYEPTSSKREREKRSLASKRPLKFPAWDRVMTGQKRAEISPCFTHSTTSSFSPSMS